MVLTLPLPLALPLTLRLTLPLTLCLTITTTLTPSPYPGRASWFWRAQQAGAAKRAADRGPRPEQRCPSGDTDFFLTDFFPAEARVTRIRVRVRVRVRIGLG